MKRTIVLAILLVAFLLTFVSSIAFAQANKVDVCHYDSDTDTYHMINISVNALDAHVNHGDGTPGDAVPGMSGYTFGDDCQPESSLAKAGCFLTASGSVYILTDGTNPQLLSPPTPTYTDNTCTVNANWDTYSNAWLWEASQAEALASCVGIGGNYVYPQNEPDLWACFGVSVSSFSASISVSDPTQ